jgi:gluconokinase
MQGHSSPSAMSSPKILIVMGVSGSGKTHIGQQLATELNWPFFDGDDFHSPENIQKMTQAIPLTDADRDDWLNSLQKLVRRQITTDQPAVIACSALKKSYRDRLKINSSVEFIYLQGSYELINRRLTERSGHYMPADLLESQFETLEEPHNALAIDVAKSSDEIVQTIKQEFWD